jgi:hypothetical protein
MLFVPLPFSTIRGDIGCLLLIFVGAAGFPFLLLCVL